MAYFHVNSPFTLHTALPRPLQLRFGEKREKLRFGQITLSKQILEVRLAQILAKFLSFSNQS